MSQTLSDLEAKYFITGPEIHRQNTVVTPIVDGDPFFTASPHTELLWALEVLAWSPEQLARAALVLAMGAGSDVMHFSAQPDSLEFRSTLYDSEVGKQVVDAVMASCL